MENDKPLSGLGLLRNAAASVKCNTHKTQLAFNLLVDSILYLEGVTPGGYYQPNRFASQLLGGENENHCRN